MPNRNSKKACLILVASLWLPMQAGAADAPAALRASYANPTDRYTHNIMGDLSAHTDLIIHYRPCAGCAEADQPVAIRLPDHLVFEDFAPRLIDLDQDGRAEIVTVESHQDEGARLAVWDLVAGQEGPVLVRGATTDFIGTRFRWLAPIGAADFDADGTHEIAYVETPHLGKTLRIVKRDGNRLRQIASVAGVTNHAIGQERVHSQIIQCAGDPVIIALDGSGKRIVAVRMIDGQATPTDHGAATTRYQLNADAVTCGDFVD